MDPLKKVNRSIFNGYKYFIGSRIASKKLKSLATVCNLEAGRLVELVFNFAFKQNIGRKTWTIDIKPLQVKSEILALCKVVQKRAPEVIVEIGTASGGTLFLFANITPAKKIVSIDMPGGSFGGSYPFWKIPLFKSFSKKRVIDLIRADSHSKETVLKLRKALKGQGVDFLFIDGDHTYEGVRKDFEMYFPFVRKGGIVAFHDIIQHDLKAGCHVDKFWHEIKQNYENEEFVEDKNQHWAGIGVLYI